MSIQIRVSEDSKHEIDAVAKEKGIQPGEAADFLIQVGASRRRALAKYAAAQGGSAKPAKAAKKKDKPAKGEKKAKAKTKGKAKGEKKLKAKGEKKAKKEAAAAEVEELTLN